jgi:hypothetical protein
MLAFFHFAPGPVVVPLAHPATRFLAVRVPELPYLLRVYRYFDNAASLTTWLFDHPFVQPVITSTRTATTTCTQSMRTKKKRMLTWTADPSARLAKGCAASSHCALPVRITRSCTEYAALCISIWAFQLLWPPCLTFTRAKLAQPWRITPLGPLGRVRLRATDNGLYEYE